MTRATARAKGAAAGAGRDDAPEDRSPRVLQVVLQLDPGGTERLVIEIARRLHPRMPMAVCCLDQPGAWAAQLEGVGIPVAALHRTPGFRPALATRIAALVDTFDIDVLHCHHYSPFVYGRMAAWLRRRCRVIYTEHGRLSDAPPSAKRRYVNPLLTRGVDECVAVSHDLRAHMLGEGMPARTRVVWNGIDPGPLPTPRSRQAARTAFAAADDAFVVASVARLDHVKDLPTLIRAVAAARAQRSTVELVIVGDGPERPHLEAVASAEAAGAVRFLGPREDARMLLHGADVYANSSISEGISLTILEAMAAALPVVATGVGGTPEVVVDGETGHLVPARDPGALAAALLDLSRRPDEARAMGEAGSRRVRRSFALDRMVAEYAAMYAGR